MKYTALENYPLYSSTPSYLPIISCEEDKRVVLHPSFLQCVEDPPHTPVQLIQGIPKCQSDTGVGELLARKLGVVGVLEGHVEEEGS